jgi:hypothetical protein
MYSKVRRFTSACLPRIDRVGTVWHALSRLAWPEVVDKMITAYKAPISPEDAQAIVDYLVRSKGAS